MKKFHVFFCDMEANLAQLEMSANDKQDCAKTIRKIFKMGDAKDLLWGVFPAERSSKDCLEEFGNVVFSKTGKEITVV